MISRPAPKSQVGLFWLSALIGLLVIPLLLVAAWGSLNDEHRREDKARLAVRSSWERRTEVQQVALLLNEAESSQRGYLLAGDPAFRRRHDAIEGIIDAEIDRLAQAYAAQPDQTRQVAELRRLTAAKFAEMDSTPISDGAGISRR